MAQQNVANLGGGAGGRIREDLANYVSNIDRDETPFVSSIGRGKATSTNHAWITDDYADPQAQAVLEGSDFLTTGGTVTAGTDAVQTARVRLSNETQIFRAQIQVSGTAIAVNTAGIANEFAYQLKKKGVEVRRYVEWQAMRLGSDSAKRTGGTVGSPTARRMGGLPTWVGVGNVIQNAATQGTLTHAAPDGTSIPSYAGAGAARGIQRSSLDALTVAMYGNGGRPNVIMMSHLRKPSFSALLSEGSTTSISERRLNAMESKLNIAISGVMTDFGFDIALVPNYVMGQFGNGTANVAYAYDSSMLKSAVLRPLHTTKLDDAGDGKRGLILEECTLEVMNPNAVGMIFGIG